MNLNVNNLSFAYAKRQILHNISFTAKTGDLLCVLGPNGVGKSTLFRCILGLMPNYIGIIDADGTNLAKLNSTQLGKTIAYIPQTSTPIFNYTVLEAVLMGATAKFGRFAMPSKVDELKAIEVLKHFNISHLAHRECTKISGGERQLMLFARALMQDAKIIIMDEPTANLDYGNQVYILEEIKKLSHQGYTIILSTHNPEHALYYGSNMIMLQEGTVIYQGDPQKIITEKTLQEVYNVDVRLLSLPINQINISVCVPLGRYKKAGA